MDGRTRRRDHTATQGTNSSSGSVGAGGFGSADQGLSVASSKIDYAWVERDVKVSGMTSKACQWHPPTVRNATP